MCGASAVAATYFFFSRFHKKLKTSVSVCPRLNICQPAKKANLIITSTKKSRAF